jgi:hypothetical protein
MQVEKPAWAPSFSQSRGITLLHAEYAVVNQCYNEIIYARTGRVLLIGGISL